MSADKKFVSVLVASFALLLLIYFGSEYIANKKAEQAEAQAQRMQEMDEERRQDRERARQEAAEQRRARLAGDVPLRAALICPYPDWSDTNTHRVYITEEPFLFYTDDRYKSQEGRVMMVEDGDGWTDVIAGGRFFVSVGAITVSDIEYFPAGGRFWYYNEISIARSGEEVSYSRSSPLGTVLTSLDCSLMDAEAGASQFKSDLKMHNDRQKTRYREERESIERTRNQQRF